MKKKLTLTIDESVTRRAKRLARREGKSVSEIVEEYLAQKTSKEGDWKPEKDSWTGKLLGSVSMPDETKEREYKELKEKEIQKKYGS